MVGPVPALTSALNALQSYTRRVDQAAAKIARAGLDTAAAAPADPSAPTGDTATDAVDLTEAMTSMRIAQRAFSAQLRVIETADEMMRESIDLGRSGGAK